LKFNRAFEKLLMDEFGNRIMQLSQIIDGRATAPQNFVTRPQAALLARFLGKFVLDILPAALASVIGGFLFSQYAGHGVTRTTTEQVTPASAEMLAMVRDEHAMMMDYLKSQMAAEKSRDAAEDAARAAADADAEVAATAAPVAPARQIAAVFVAPRAASARSRKPVAIAAVPSAPLVIAQADQNADGQNQSDGPVPDDRLARDPDSLLAKTLDLKDHVVAATRQVVAAIGDVFASVGQRIGGAAPGVRPFSSPS
jgi:hypothetical protein